MSRKNPELNKIGRTPDRISKMTEILKKRQLGLTVIAENIYDPHNLSAMLRSCDAVGVFEVCLIYDGSQPFPKLGEKSSAGVKKWIKIERFDTVEDCYSYVRVQGKKIFTTHLSKESKSLYDLDLTLPTALVFGNEHFGVSEEAVELADGNFLIPQVGMVQSLNISVAAAVSLYEAFRQRAKKGLYEQSELKEKQFELALDSWKQK